ncbi:hypothetical protein [Jejuia spongiicola]|uniref:Sugar transporter n=1 Tax=Jejuia spongiicola TaxID=2942207 RepID=A0ABT0QDI0_9FLAO|nr:MULTISPECIES: hypothetical protein [Flavobacteriaceae]MCL6295049.1 hypothetical protein [Jejuia spongiicola]PIA77589.1 hypothetical protein BFR04_09110 [Gaetbulibacter sp. 4G1]
MTNSSTKPPVWFWVVSVLALIWNGMGVMAYLARAYATDEMIAALPEEQQAEFLVEHPTWYTAAFAIAVFAGALGCIALLLRKKMAYILFVLSGLSAIIQHIYLFMNVDIPSMVMPIMIIVVCLFLIWFSKNSISKGWIS